MNEELDTVDSAPDWVFIAPRNVVNDAFSGSADPTRIACDKTHVISRESIYDTLTDKRIEIAKAHIILAIELDVLGLVARSHLTRKRQAAAGCRDKLAKLISIWGQPARESFRSWLHRLVRCFHSPLIHRMNPGRPSSLFYRIRKSRQMSLRVHRMRTRCKRDRE